MKHKTILTLFALILSLAALAGPARRGPIPLTQPDGTTFNALFRGDEFMKIKSYCINPVDSREDGGATHGLTRKEKDIAAAIRLAAAHLPTSLQEAWKSPIPDWP